MNSAWVHYSQLTYQQLQAEQKKMEKKKRKRKRVKRETQPWTWNPNTYIIFGVICFFFYLMKIPNILTYTYQMRGEGFKEIDSGVYPKKSNSWIH